MLPLVAASPTIIVDFRGELRAFTVAMESVLAILSVKQAIGLCLASKIAVDVETVITALVVAIVEHLWRSLFILA